MACVGAVMRFVQRWWVPLLVGCIAVIGTCLTFYHWDWLHRELPNGQQDPSATIRNVGLVVAALEAIVLAVWRSVIAQEQASIAQEQADTARRSLRGERFQKAAEMLVGDQLSVRIGGIYGLCQLARDYPKEFHLQVVHLLAAFVRYPTPIEAPQEVAAVAGVTRIGREDIQAIVQFFFTRSSEGREVEKARSYSIDLTGSDLSGVDFPHGSDLAGLDLKYTSLSGATFNNVRGLTTAQLHGARAEQHPALFTNVHDSETGKPLDSELDTVINARPLGASSRPSPN